jgi:hypothetical protein
VAPLLDSTRPLFDPSRGFRVKVAFYGNGRHYQPGDRFDPRDAECDDRRVRMLWEQRLIDCEPADSANSPKSEEIGESAESDPELE